MALLLAGAVDRVQAKAARDETSVKNISGVFYERFESIQLTLLISVMRAAPLPEEAT